MELEKTQLEPPQKFGTFLGVYTPSVLTILGLIMYLRFGWVVGNIGLPLTLFVVLLSSSITFITGLSASAIATNMRVGVGGEYYITWASAGITDVFIEYSPDNGDEWIPIDTVPAKGGRYTWIVPDNPSQFCVVRISDTGGQPVDMSDAVFTIILD